MAKIVILGAGLAGLSAAETLVGKLGAEHRVTVIAPNKKFTFFPALVPFVFGKLKQEDIRFDLYEKLTQHGIRFIQSEVLGVDPIHKEITITGEDVEGKISYDYLIVATGRRLATEKTPGFFEYAHHLLGIDAAIKFREAINNFYEGNILVGMCPGARLPVPILETVLALSKKFEKQIDEGLVTINAIFPTSLREIFAEAPLFAGAEHELKKHGITLIENFPVVQVKEKQILTADNKILNSGLVMLVPSFRGQAMLKALGKTAIDDEGFARVDPHLQIEGLKHHYAAGDIAAFSGPKFGYLAVRQGEVAAENIVSEIKGEQPHKVYIHEISPIYKPAKESIFMHYGIWDNDLYSPVEGTVLSWANEIRDKYETMAA